jgi:hypothetical protein
MRRRTLVIAGSAAAVVLVGTVLGVGLSRSDPALPTMTASPAAADSSCGLPGTVDETTAGATTVTWTDVAGRPLPVSATDGPGARDEKGPWSCYSRTRSGAVLAGYVIPLRIGLADDRRAVIQQQTVPSPGQAVLLSSVSNSSEIVTARGFDIASYSADASTIRYRLSTANGEYTCTTDVRWFEGDWRLVVGDDGSTSSGCVRGVPDEFTPWGP